MINSSNRRPKNVASNQPSQFKPSQELRYQTRTAGDKQHENNKMQKKKGDALGLNKVVSFRRRSTNNSNIKCNRRKEKRRTRTQLYHALLVGWLVRWLVAMLALMMSTLSYIIFTHTNKRIQLGLWIFCVCFFPTFLYTYGCECVVRKKSSLKLLRYALFSLLACRFVSHFH